MYVSIKAGDDEKGAVRHCIITPRRDSAEPMFYGRADGTIVANLVGYRITPLTEDEMRALGYKPDGDGRRGEGGDERAALRYPHDDMGTPT